MPREGPCEQPRETAPAALPQACCTGPGSRQGNQQGPERSGGALGCIQARKKRLEKEFRAAAAGTSKGYPGSQVSCSLLFKSGFDSDVQLPVGGSCWSLPS